MKKIFWLVVGFVAVMGFSVYVAEGETGPIGWINAGQVAAFGTYSRRISALLLMALVAFPVWALWAAVSPASLQRQARKVSDVIDAPLGPTPKATTWIKWLLLVWLLVVALVWAGVFGWGAWQQHLKGSDATAAYLPLELASGMKDAAAGHDHLALHGRVLGDHVVSRKAGSDGSAAMMLVPVVEQGWRDGDPVHFVVRLGAEGEWALRGALQKPSESLLVRTDGSVPTLAAQVFERMRAPLADDAVTVVLVAAQDGKPAAPTDGDSGDVVMWGTIGTGIVTLVVAMFAAAMVGSAREERKRAAKTLKQAGR